MRLEAPRRAVPPPSWCARLRGAAQRLGVSTRVPVPSTGGGSAVRVVARHCLPEQAPARGGVRDAKPGAGADVLSRVSCGGLVRRDRGVADGAGRRKGVVVAGAATAVRVPPGALLGRGKSSGGGGPRPGARLGQARAQGHGRAAAGGLMPSRSFALGALLVLLAGRAQAQGSKPSPWTGGVRAATAQLTDSTSLGALSGVIEYRALGWLRFGAAPTLVRSTAGSTTTSEFRSQERRVGKECRQRLSPESEKKKIEKLEESV